MKRNKARGALLKVLVFLLSLVPFLILLFDTLTDRLGANPIETLHFSLGAWALRFLCITLALRPVKIMTGQAWLLRYRRMMGLYALFYASMHFLVFIVLDQSLSWEQIQDEIVQSPYILMGLFAYLLMVPLALTSTRKMQQRLGKYWKKLHRLVFVAAVAAVIHYFWLVKLDYREPLIYALMVLFLIGIRVFDAYRYKWKKSLPVALKKGVS